jgi:hypothetical protein
MPLSKNPISKQRESRFASIYASINASIFASMVASIEGGLVT